MCTVIHSLCDIVLNTSYAFATDEMFYVNVPYFGVSLPLIQVSTNPLFSSKH